MGIVLHWFLPTNGDSRTDLSLGNAVGAAGSRVVDGGPERAPDIGYIGQIARSAEQLGFTGALTPTSVFVGIARNALDDAVEFVRTRARLWYESTADRASEDLYIQLRVGEMKTAVDAAELLSLRAAELCDEAVANPGDQHIRGEASVVTGQARVAAADAALFAGSTLFKVCGAGSVLEKYGFDRHWRNARTLSLHNPLDFKSMHAGDYLLNDRLPPVDSYN